MSEVLEFPVCADGAEAANWAAWFRLRWRAPSLAQRAAFRLGMEACAAGEALPLPGGQHQLAILEGFRCARDLARQTLVIAGRPTRARRSSRYPKVL